MICTCKYRFNLCVGISLIFVKYFEDYLDKNGVERNYNNVSQKN